MLLAIDTATRRVGIALYDGAQVLHEIAIASPLRHTVDLAVNVERALASTSGQGALSCIAVALGPGSFTGLRIGMAFAKGLALAQTLPLVGIPTHDILAYAQPVGEEERLAAVIEAGRGRLAVRWYTPAVGRWRAEGEPQLLTSEELGKEIRNPTLVCGDLGEELRKLLGRKRKNVSLVLPAASLRRAGYLAELGWLRLQVGDVDDPATLAPVYLRTNEDLPA